MQHLGAYPGVALRPGGAVAGEVQAIGPALERVPDEIEDVLPQRKDEYCKREVRAGAGER